MAFELMKLPYEINGLEPHMSKETLEYHYGKHHQGYVTKLNGLVGGTEFEGASLEDIISKAPEPGALYNNAAQIWNHDFYWKCLKPGGSQVGGRVSKALTEHFGSVDKFKETFTAACLGLFGSGWVWLVQDTQGKLVLESLVNAGNPLRKNQKSLLVCDVWEHAYYLDHRNSRPQFLEAFWQVLNWDFVESHL